MRITLLALLLFVPLLAQPPQGAPGGGQRRMPEPKNLKVLKIPHAELIPLMRNFNASLGVQCTFCHVPNQFDSDEKKEKLVARQMIQMVDDINTKTFEGKVQVGCFTCHRGDKEPKLNPPMPERNGPPPGAPAPAKQP